MCLGVILENIKDKKNFINEGGGGICFISFAQSGNWKWEGLKKKVLEWNPQTLIPLKINGGSCSLGFSKIS